MNAETLLELIRMEGNNQKYLNGCSVSLLCVIFEAKGIQTLGLYVPSHTVTLLNKAKRAKLRKIKEIALRPLAYCKLFTCHDLSG